MVIFTCEWMGCVGEECGAGIAPEDTAVRIKTSSAGANQLSIDFRSQLQSQLQTQSELRGAGKVKASFQWGAALEPKNN
jgi:hypothetical protein